MKLKDARKISSDELLSRRKQAVLLKKQGMNYREIGKVVGVHPNTVGLWLRKYGESGAKGLKPKVRGLKKGQGRSLSIKQERKIKSLLTDRMPDQLKLPFALWTREAVSLLIHAKFEIKMPLRTVGDYLKRWGMTPQKPVKRAYERSEPAVKRWLKEEYPEIRKQAAKNGAEIHWADETGLRSGENRGRSFAPKGKTPVRKSSGKVEKANMISSVTNQGKLRFMFYEERFTQHVLIRFLKRLVKDGDGRPIVVIMDNHPSHHGKVVKAWAKENKEQITLAFLPSYSPDLNPDEFLNCDLKTQIAKRPERREKGHLKDTARRVLRSLQKQPARIASYFTADSINYAAA